MAVFVSGERMDVMALRMDASWNACNIAFPSFQDHALKTQDSRVKEEGHKKGQEKRTTPEAPE